MTMYFNRIFKRTLIKRIKNPQKNYSTEATFVTKPFNLHKLTDGPSTQTRVTKDEAIQYFTQMQSIRRLESAAAGFYKEKLIRGFCHLYSGQEAVAVGMRSVMRPQDAVIAGYRIHGWVYIMGASPFNILSELSGKEAGVARGKGGSMHMYLENFYGGSGIVGAQVPMGAGLAFALKYLNTGGVSFTLYGDGAANQGQIFETFNMAKLWNLPCIFVCENNGFGMGTSATRSSANTAYHTRGDYIPGIRVDGMDVIAVREATKFAIEYAVAEKGPLVMEMATYRYSGHSMSDPGTSYRTREEIKKVKSLRDPIFSFKNKIISLGLATEVELKQIEKDIKKEIQEYANKAKAEKDPDKEELTADVYAKPLESSIRNVLPNQGLKPLQIGQAWNLQ